MVRQSKSTPSTTVSSSPAPVVQETVAPKKSASKSAKKTTEQPVVSAPVSVPEPVQVVTETPVTPVQEESTMVSRLSVFGAKLTQLNGLFSSLKSDFKLLEKQVSRELKTAQKQSSRKRKTNVNRQPSGFVKPTKISDELARFLGKEVGTELARTAVSKEINNYIRTNGLQDKENGRKINADAKLSALLKLGKDDELTYFNLQKYMKHHFVKAPVATA
jgi:chromatin remodeling complex protein RSC6